jgi:hypothetical protein
MNIERPEDIERLWREAEPLTESTLPGWLDRDTMGLYRRVTAAPVGRKERDALEVAGLVVDDGGVYVGQPTLEVFSIAIAVGGSPVELSAPAGPCLTRDDVTDVTAALVADPFMLRRADGWHMFFEVWDWHQNKGAIGHARSGDGRAWSYESLVLEEDFHLSYPYVFEWAGEVYLVPESFRAEGVRLYRARTFPSEWECVAELIAGALVDPCPFHAAGRWWLLAGGKEGSELRLYGASDLLGTWEEHPASPVVADDPVRSRPAGRVVVVDGDRILRFAQRCDTGYGLDVRAFEIEELTAAHYSERELPGPILAASGVGWNAAGMHHVDPHRLGADSWLACVDGWRAPGT